MLPFGGFRKIQTVSICIKYVVSDTEAQIGTLELMLHQVPSTKLEIMMVYLRHGQMQLADGKYLLQVSI